MGKTIQVICLVAIITLQLVSRSIQESSVEESTLQPQADEKESSLSEALLGFEDAISESIQVASVAQSNSKNETKLNATETNTAVTTKPEMDNETIMFQKIGETAISVLIPPLAIYLERGIGTEFITNIGLTLFGFVPGLAHAIYTIWA